MLVTELNLLLFFTTHQRICFKILRMTTNDRLWTTGVLLLSLIDYRESWLKVTIFGVYFQRGYRYLLLHKATVLLHNPDGFHSWNTYKWCLLESSLWQPTSKTVNVCQRQKSPLTRKRPLSVCILSFFSLKEVLNRISTKITSQKL